MPMSISDQMKLKAQARLRMQAQAGAGMSVPPVGDMPPDRSAGNAGVIGALDTMTFGTLDEIVAGLDYARDNVMPSGKGRSYSELLDAKRRDYDKTAEDHPIASTVGSIAGIAPAMIGGGLGIAGRVGGRLTGAALEGAAQSAAYGAGSADGDLTDRMAGAAVGGATGAALGATTAGVINKFAERAARKAIPSTEAIRNEGKAALDAAENSGLIYTPAAVSDLRSRLTKQLTDKGWTPRLDPEIGGILGTLDDLAGQNATWKGMDNVRAAAGDVATKAYKGLQPDERLGRYSTILKKEIENFTESTTDVIPGSGDAAAVNRLAREGRDLYARGARSKQIDKVNENIDLRYLSTGKGGNEENVTRQAFRKMAENPRGKSPAEFAAANRITRGNRVQNALRLGGSLAPSGPMSIGLLTSLATGGAAYGGPVVAAGVGALSAASLASKKLATRMARKSVDRLSEVTRSGGMTAKEIGQRAMAGRGSTAMIEKARKLAIAERRALPLAGFLGAQAAEEMRPVPKRQRIELTVGRKR